MTAPEHDPLLEQAMAVSRRSRRLGANALCVDCGMRRHLRQVGELVLCYGCRARRAGRRSFEDDHLAGRATWGSLTVRLRANDHRTVTELRTVLGFDDLPDADGDPVLLVAHLAAGLATLLALLVEYLVAWALELRQRYGPDWARGLPSPVVA